MLHNSGTTGVRHNFLLPLGHNAWAIHNLLLTCLSNAFSQTFKMLCNLRGSTSTCFISLVQLLFKQAHTVSQKIDWAGLCKNFTLKCGHLYLSFCSLMQLEFYEVSQKYYELEKDYPHLTDEWTKPREVSGRGGSPELQQTQSVGTWLSALPANLPPSQVLCWASAEAVFSNRQISNSL